ncbi:Hsp20/alpha crystallin family protein [Patulibacter americanus]|uniref:Hsp20/alpha crystallin family protein n=1 Tax=Patulibacter americanus TaxID=588672 RepID=UPI0003B47ED8|nr:Hsp20/alpha crystallin family protein [Patulibacter americanus]
MAIVRWEPARELGSLQQEVNRVFSTFFDPAVSSTPRWTPAVDLIEREGSFVLVADLPGMAEDDIAIEVEGDTLTLSGARTLHDETRREHGVIRAERAAGQFRRTLTLPEGVDADRITASFDRGVLEVSIPKPEQAKPRRVSIEVGRRPGTIEGASSAGEGAGSAAEPATTAA